MANRIKELKTRALEISKTAAMLEGQKKINTRDLSINNELLGIRIEDDSDESEIKSLSKAVTGEQTLIDGRIGENQKDIDKTAEEADSGINALSGNISTMETMDKISRGLAKSEVGRQKRDTGKKIDELKDVNRMLGVEEPSPGRVKESFKRIGAGVGVLITGLAGGVSVLRNPTEKYSVPEAVPAIQCSFERPQKENPPNVTQKVVEIGDAITEIMQAHTDAMELSNKRKEWVESGNLSSRRGDAGSSPE